MAMITVTHLGGDAFDICTRDHTVTIDQPVPGRIEVGPTPTELFVASLAGCAAYCVEQFLRRHGLPYHGLRVEAGWAMRAATPARISRVNLRIVPPEPVPEYHCAELIAAVEACTVRNSLREPPAISVDLAGADRPRRPAMRVAP